MAFGDFAQFSQSLAKFDTSSAVWVTKPAATFTTPALTAGDYAVGYSSTWSVMLNPANQHAMQIRMLQDAVTPLMTANVFQEIDIGNIAPDSQVGAYDMQLVTLGAGVHTFEVQCQRVGGLPAQTVSLQNTTLWLYKLDRVSMSFDESRTLAQFNTISTAYQLVESLGPLTLQAGTYRILAGADYNDDTNAPGDLAIRVRERKDPAGANIITNLYGDNAAGADEAFFHLAGLGVFGVYNRFAWVTTCRDLLADDYTYEMHLRSRIAFANVELANRMIVVMRLSD